MGTLDETETRQPPVQTGELALGSRLRRDQVFSALFGQAAQTRVGHFVLLEPIATGGMGELFAAYDEQLDRKIALKLVRTDRASARAEARLLREAQALAKLSHPNVITVYDAGLDEHRVFVAMEYVRGKTLSAWLDEAAGLPEPTRVRRLLELFRDAGRGLEAVHRAGLAHRDFKPDNVLVGEDGRVRVLDFGLARPTAEISEEREEPNANANELERVLAELELGEHDSTPDLVVGELGDNKVGTLTAAGTLLGTPRYMAPEQWRATRGDARSDQFSFCVALFHALHGRWPFAGESSQELRATVLAGELRVAARKPEISARLQAALLCGLQVDPTLRNRDMSELLAAIDELLAPPRRRLAASLGMLSLGAALIVATFLATREPPRPLATQRAIVELERELEAEQRRMQIAATVEQLDRRGSADEADVVFETFAALPRHANTRALAQAWLDQARRLRERGEVEGELLALGEAQLASANQATRRPALVELAHALARSHRYAQLGATLHVLDSLPGGREGELLELEVREALSRRDFEAAIDLLAQSPSAPTELRPALPILRELARVTTTDHLAPELHPLLTALVPLPTLDLDGDQTSELLFVPEQGTELIVAGRPNLPALQPIELPVDDALDPTPALRPVARALGRAGGPSWVLADAGPTRALFELERVEDRVVVERVPIDAMGTRWVVGELFDAWPGWEGIGASSPTRRLLGLRGCATPDSTCLGFEPSPSLAVLGSFPDELAIADLDADGEDELAVTVSGWWAFDVRVLTPRAEPAGSFELAARLKLGAPNGLVAFPSPKGPGHWLAVSVPNSPPSPRVFPPEQPAGVAPGVHLLAWAGPGRPLERVQSIGLPDANRPAAGDFDGDGRHELVVQLVDAIVVLVADPEGHYTPLWLEGLHHQAIADLDADGDAELIVRDNQSSRVLVLGSGNESMPSLPRRVIRPVAPPPGLDRVQTEHWQRAETLATIGLVEAARPAFEALAQLLEPRSAGLAHRRAGELAELAGLRREAAAAYERAGDLDSLERALALDEATNEFDDAARLALRLAQAEGLDAATQIRWTERAERLRGYASPRDQLTFDFRKPLDDHWRVARAGLLRAEPEGLRVHVLGAPDSILLRRTLEWTGDRLRLELDFDLERLEWASSLQVELIPLEPEGKPSPMAPFLTMRSQGGGDHYTLDFDGGWQLEPGSVGSDRVMRGAAPPAGPRQFRLALDVLAGSDRSWQTVTTLDDEATPATHLSFERPTGRLQPGRFELRISTGSEPWMRGTLRLERLALLGARDAEGGPASARELVALALARGDDDDALATMERHADAFERREAAWLRVLTLEQLGRWSNALPELERAIAGCDDASALAYFGHALLLQPDRYAPSLRRICSRERFLLATWAVAASTLFQHKDLDDLHRTLTTHLVDVDRFEPRDVEQALAVMGLLTARARGWSMQELASAAESDLRRVIELGRAWTQAPLAPADPSELRRAVSIAHLELAGVLITRGRNEAAEREVEAALANDVAPEIIADIVVARPVFAPLRTAMVWSAIVLAQRGRSPLADQASTRPIRAK